MSQDREKDRGKIEGKNNISCMEISSDRVQSKLVCTSNNHQMNLKTSSAEEQTNLLCSYIIKKRCTRSQSYSDAPCICL